jgi:hypothetical protein
VIGFCCSIEINTCKRLPRGVEPLPFFDTSHVSERLLNSVRFVKPQARGLWCLPPGTLTRL